MESLIKLKQRRENAAKGRNLVAYYHQDSGIAEQYRKIYTNIKFSSADQENQVMLIISPGYKEGKTTTTVNLGASIAQLGQKVLIIDADLRKPTLHKTFRLENGAGLTNVLLGEQSFDEVVKQTGTETLDILTSGPASVNPAKLLGSKAMEGLIRTALHTHDIVLIDTPPFLEMTDASILVNICDGVILVVRKEKTKVEQVNETKRLLGLSRARLIGSILNEKT